MGGNQVAGGLGAATQGVQQAPAGRVGQGLEDHLVVLVDPRPPRRHVSINSHVVSRRQYRTRCHSTRANVLVVMEDVVGVVLGLDLGESPVRVIAVGLSSAAGVVVGIKE